LSQIAENGMQSVLQLVERASMKTKPAVRIIQSPMFAGATAVPMGAGHAAWFEFEAGVSMGRTP
jgi:hypothetical protein